MCRHSLLEGDAHHRNHRRRDALGESDGESGESGVAGTAEVEPLGVAHESRDCLHDALEGEGDERSGVFEVDTGGARGVWVFGGGEQGCHCATLFENAVDVEDDVYFRVFHSVINVRVDNTIII